MAKKQRIVEVFTAGCPICEEAVKVVKSAICPECQLKIYDLREGCAADECHDKATRYGVKRVPAVAVDGELLDCCRSDGISFKVLRAAGVGQGMDQ